MNAIGAVVDDQAADLTIGDLAEQTGLTPAVLRAWESRHGFPVPTRLASGHRRYRASDVELVQRVLRRRDAGIRLDVAIAEAAGMAPPAPPSIFAELRRRHPHLAVHRLRKSTLVAMSRAIEDECCARADRPIVIGAFQREEFYRRSEARWDELARIAHRALAFARDFPEIRPRPGGIEAAEDGPVLVRLEPDSPMAREWVVISDGPGMSACLSAWELPGQADVRDRDRIFETIWTVDPVAVRDATTVAAAVAAGVGSETGAALLEELQGEPQPSRQALDATSLFDRMLVYVDRLVSPTRSR